MNKKGCRRIIGLFIFALTLILSNIISVNAEDKVCDKVDNEVILQVYGLSVSYDETNNKYVIKSQFNKEVKDYDEYSSLKEDNIKFKITDLYFYEPLGVQEDENGNEKEVQITDVEMIKDVDANGSSSEYYENVEHISDIDKFVSNGISGLSLGKSSSITVDPTIFNSNNNTNKESQFGIAFKIKPDGFKDPKVIKDCESKNATFFAIVSVAYEKGEDAEPEEIEDEIPTPSTTVTSGWLDCTNYEQFDINSFKYKFCADKDASVGRDGKEKKKNTQKFTIKKNQNGEMIKYEDVGNTYTSGLALKYQCDYTVTQNSTNSSNYYVNKNYLYGTGTLTYSEDYQYTGEYNKEGETKKATASCTITCEEVVKVEYGPPVASKAGLCFEYKVKVTSRVNCKGDLPNKPPTQITCTPTPVCEHTDGRVWPMAGPNEDFDECVQSCDGGVYSDKCVNKCYKEVYGTSFVRQVTGTEIAFDDTDTTNINGITDISKVPYQYLVKNAKIVWYTGTTGTTRKISNKGGTREGWTNINDADSYWHKHHRWGYSKSKYVNYTKEGIPAKSSCNSISCKWVRNSKGKCTGNNSSYYRYYNSPNVYKASYEKGHGGKTYKYKRPDKTDYTKLSKYYKDKEENKKIYDRLVAKCKAYAACNTTTTEFTISVDYTEKGPNKTKQTINFPYTENNDKNSKDTIQHSASSDSVACPTSENSVILSSAGCYNCSSNGIDTGDTEKDADGKVKMYMTEWSFPGTWINNKNGMISYTPASDKNWKKIKEKFCLPLNAANVNQEWYNYYQYQTKGTDSTYSYYDLNYIRNVQCPDGTELKTVCGNTSKPNKVDYNIRATTRKFGLYEWDIDIECFYATNDLFPKVNESDKCSLTCGGTEKYRVRSVDLNNLFPDQTGTDLDNKGTTGRTPGFNWSTYANQTNKDKEYASTPANYAKWIQYTGTGVYNDEYLDYEVTLTKDIISEIKKTANKKYTNWEGEIINDGDEYSANSYRSPLFKQGGLLAGNTSVYPSGNALKCNNIGAHTKSNGYDAECADYKDFNKEGE